MHKTTHTPSCFKTDDDKRKGKCRLRFPHDLIDETSIDPATGLIRIKRNNAWGADYNDYILLGMQCNTNIILIPVRENARAQVCYITAYATKIDLKNREMYALLHAPLAKYKVDAEDADTRPLGNKLQMQMARLHQRSSTEIVSYLMGWNDNYKMHSYTSSPPSQYVFQVFNLFSFFSPHCDRHNIEVYSYRSLFHALFSISSHSFPCYYLATARFLCDQHKFIVQVVEGLQRKYQNMN